MTILWLNSAVFVYQGFILLLYNVYCLLLKNYCLTNFVQKNNNNKKKLLSHDITMFVTWPHHNEFFIMSGELHPVSILEIKSRSNEEHCIVGYTALHEKNGTKALV